MLGIGEGVVTPALGAALLGGYALAAGAILMHRRDIT
jgi:hypothetical protein